MRTQTFIEERPPPNRAERLFLMNLKLRWARFFTLAGWDWKLSTRPGFDFEVHFRCHYPECTGGEHTLLVRVRNKPRHVLQNEYLSFSYPYEEPNPALFGNGPANTYWEMVHRAREGEAQVGSYWTPKDADWLWERAAHD
jgi:hypothetical protein